MMISRLLLAATLAIGSAHATISGAMPEMPLLRVIGVEDGLPSSSINGITQDRDGYIWVATTDGLARYDGTGVRTWRHDPADPGSLPGNLITYVHVDDDNRVWIAVEARGLSVLDPDRKTLRHYRMDDDSRIGSDDTWAIASRAGELWFGTYGGGLHRLDADGTITRFMPRDGDPRSLPSETVTSLAFDDDGTLWIGTLSGLARWTGHDFERLMLPDEAPAPVVYSVTPHEGGLWVGASVGVFLREAAGGWRDVEWSAMFAKPNALLSVALDRDGDLWLGTQRSIWHVSPGQVPVPVPMGAHGPTRAVQQMHGEGNGALWLPVAGRGLGYLRPDWRTIAQFSRERGGLGSTLYLGMTPAAQGGLWLMGERGEIEHLDADGQVRPLPESVSDALAHLRPTSIVEDGEGRLWLGTTGFDASLLRVDPDDTVHQWRPDEGADGTLGGTIPLMALAPDGTLWLVCSSGGVQQRDVASGRVLVNVHPGPRQGLGVGDLEAMRFDSAGALWVAGDTGLLRWDAARQHFETVPGLGGDRVYGFDFDGDGTLWLQRLAGLEHYRHEGDRWRRQAIVGPAQGIPAVEGQGLHVDARHRVWLATARGLFRWDHRQRQLRRFGMPDGLSSHQFVDHATVLTDDGILAGALEDGGVVLVDTRADDPSPVQPQLRWDSVEVRRGGQWQVLDATPSRTLTPRDRELRVQLRLLAFDNPDASRYFTRLDGYDPDWVAQGSSGERILAGLPPGAYTLRARAADAAGNVSREQTLVFAVQPPWWRTSWAWAGFAGMALLLLWWVADVYRERLAQRHARERAEHEREVAQQASLAKTRFLATLGHEVRTPMTGVLGMSELLLGTTLDTRQRGYTESIRRAGEHLLRLVNDALDLARIESGKLELDDAAVDLHALIDEAVALTAPLARQRGLAFASRVDDDVPRHVRGDGKRICQILLNLLGNATKFTEHGEISLHVSRASGDAVRFDVADTGPGLNDEQVERLFRRFEQAEGARTAARYGGSGLGLAICQELAAAMQGRIRVDSTPGRGTQFSVELPLPRTAAPPGVAEVSTTAASRPRLSLLLVEDDATVADVISGLLHSQGHRVTHATNSLAALTEIATDRFDAALLDLDLPGMDGLALARQLRAQGFTQPLIAATARADAEAEPEAMQAGFDRFIRKPLTGTMLAQVLEDLRSG